MSKEVDAVWSGKGRWSDEEARTALAILLGEEQLRAAVDAVIAHRSGSELAQYVLQLLRPWVAMQRCYDRYRSTKSQRIKQAAAELLSTGHPPLTQAQAQGNTNIIALLKKRGGKN